MTMFYLMPMFTWNFSFKYFNQKYLFSILSDDATKKYYLGTSKCFCFFPGECIGVTGFLSFMKLFKNVFKH